MGTIRDFIDQADANQLILPSIQREYVWAEEQICKLFDSIMSDYPIGYMMLWKLDGERIKDKGIAFYRLLNSYNEMIPENNEKLNNPSPDKTYYAILDGQQRTQSLFIGLRGYLKLKLYRARKNNADSYKDKYLYLNLIGEPNENEDYKYEFKFLADEETNSKENIDKLFFKVGEILTFSNVTDIDDVDLIKKENLTEEQVKMAKKNLHKLYQKINDSTEVLHWEEVSSSKTLDDVLNIFVRTNSGGTVLSKTDLLFSTVVANWGDARRNIEDLLNIINNKGGEGVRFNFSKDFIMRALMYLLDEPVTLNIKNLKENIVTMQSNWEDLKKAILKVTEALRYAGYNSENLISYNAVMPLAYYFYKNGKFERNELLNYDSREELKKYLVVAQMKKLYGTASNSTLTNVRTALTDEKGQLKNKYFKLSDLKDVKIVGERNFDVDEEIIDSWFNENKNAYTFMILSILYPCSNISTVSYHQDHMHPQSKLKQTKFDDLKDKLANLQLLPGSENESKLDTPLKEWLINDPERKRYTKYLPDNCSYEVEDFDVFIEKRQELMKKELLNILKI